MMKVGKTTLAVIMPVYNEAEGVRNTIKKWLRELDALGIGFVLHVYNDGSKDDSLKVLEEISKEDSRVLVHNKLNSGHGPTILLGYRENGNAEWIFQVDSDNELDPGAFKELWKNKDSYDFLIGQRTTRISVLTRKALSSVAWFMVRVFYGQGIRDVNIPYRLMRYERFKKHFYNIPKDVFAPNIILSGIACAKKYRIFVCDVTHSNRVYGVSTNKWKLLLGGVHSCFQILIFRFFKLGY